MSFFPVNELEYRISKVGKYLPSDLDARLNGVVKEFPKGVPLELADEGKDMVKATFSLYFFLAFRGASRRDLTVCILALLDTLLCVDGDQIVYQRQFGRG